MTLADFRRETAHLPGETTLTILDPWGEIEPAAWVTADDLVEGDPLLDDLRPDQIVLTGEAS